MANAPLQIHIWPGRWELPSVDASCIEAVLYLQLTVPNRYAIVETADPDQSPNGQLPFLTHGQLVISSLPSIISYLSHLNASLLSSSLEEHDDYDDGGGGEDEPPPKMSLDANLGGLQVSQAAAWRAYIEAQLGDIVAHSFLVLYPNYRAFTREVLASMLPVPQRYYVPNRIKESYRPRLEAAGLWALANEPDEAEGETKTAHSEFRRSFGQMKVVERARLAFDVLSRLLGEKPFLFGDDRPAATDVAMASRILLLVRAPLPNPILKEVLEKSYAGLVEHASRTYALAFAPDGVSSSSSSPPPPPPPVVSQPRASPLAILRGSLKYLGSGFGGAMRDESEDAKRFRRYRLGWLALALAGVGGFFAASGLRLARPSGDDGEDGGDSEVVIDDDDDEGI